jgi:hypothetical protein
MRSGRLAPSYSEQGAGRRMTRRRRKARTAPGVPQPRGAHAQYGLRALREFRRGAGSCVKIHRRELSAWAPVLKLTLPAVVSKVPVMPTSCIHSRRRHEHEVGRRLDGLGGDRFHAVAVALAIPTGAASYVPDRRLASRTRAPLEEKFGVGAGYFARDRGHGRRFQPFTWAAMSTGAASRATLGLLLRACL